MNMIVMYMYDDGDGDDGDDDDDDDDDCDCRGDDDYEGDYENYHIQNSQVFSNGIWNCCTYFRM